MITISSRPATPAEATAAFKRGSETQGGLYGCLVLCITSAAIAAAFVISSAGSHLYWTWTLLSIFIGILVFTTLIKRHLIYKSIKLGKLTATLLRVDLPVERVWPLSLHPEQDKVIAGNKITQTNWLFQFAAGHFGIIGTGMGKANLSPLQSDFKMGGTIIAEWAWFDDGNITPRPYLVRSEGPPPVAGKAVEWHRAPAGAYCIDFVWYDSETGVTSDLAGLVSYIESEFSDGALIVNDKRNRV